MFKIPELSAEHLDMLDLIGQEAHAMLQSGDPAISAHASKWFTFASILSVIAQNVIALQAQEKAAKQAARGEPVTATAIPHLAPAPIAALSPADAAVGEGTESGVSHSADFPVFAGFPRS